MMSKMFLITDEGKVVQTLFINPKRVEDNAKLNSSLDSKYTESVIDLNVSCQSGRSVIRSVMSNMLS